MTIAANKAKPLVLATFLLALGVGLLQPGPPLYAQRHAPGEGAIICCNMIIGVGGDWFGAIRNCSEYLRSNSVARARACAALAQACALVAQKQEPPEPLVAALAGAPFHPLGKQGGSGVPCNAAFAALVLRYTSAPAGRSIAPRPGQTWDYAQAPGGEFGCCPEVAEQCGPDNCKSDPADSGFVYVGGPGPIRTQPSTNGTVVGQPPVGGRLVYTQVTQSGGQTWYYVHPPGGVPGWFSGENVSCSRPRPTPPTRPLPLPPGFGLANTSSPGPTAARG